MLCRDFTPFILSIICSNIMWKAIPLPWPSHTPDAGTWKMALPLLNVTTFPNDENSFKQEMFQRAWTGTPSNKKCFKEPGQELLQIRNLTKSLDMNSFKQEILERAGKGTPSSKKSLKEPGQDLLQTKNP